MSDIKAELLLQAYAEGIFPMAPSRESKDLKWYCPGERGILPLENPHVPRRLMRTVLAGAYHVTSDRDFEGVVHACAEPAPGREETWISPRICALYTELYRMGKAHSVEVWDDAGHLLGGLYGVSLGAAFFGESMVSRVRDISKIALIHLIAALRQGGYHLLDTQCATSHLGRFGGGAVSFPEYQFLLGKALAQEGQWPEDISLPALRASLLCLKKKAGVNT